MKCLLILAFALLTASPLLAQEADLPKAEPWEVCSAEVSPGHFSRAGIAFCFKDEQKRRRRVYVRPPDRNALLIVWEHGMDLYNKKGEPIDAERSTDISSGAWGEAIWSPDSRYLLITRGFLSGGLYAPLEVQVGSMDYKYPLQWDNKCEETGIPGHLRCKRGVDSLIRRDYMERHKSPCASENDINIWGLTWREGSSQAVVIVQKKTSYDQCEKKLSHDISDDFEAYVVSIPQREIIDRLPRDIAIQRWGYLMGWLQQ